MVLSSLCSYVWPLQRNLDNCKEGKGVRMGHSFVVILWVMWMEKSAKKLPLPFFSGCVKFT